MSAVIVAQLLYLESQSTEKPISMYINSPGGVVTSGLAIYDTMQYVQAPVATLCIGQACSMGSLLLAGGAPGMRQALPNARVMIHQPSGGFSGQASDIEIHAREILATRERLTQLYAKHTGQPAEVVRTAKERDTFMTPQQVWPPSHTCMHTRMHARMHARGVAADMLMSTIMPCRMSPVPDRLPFGQRAAGRSTGA